MTKQNVTLTYTMVVEIDRDSNVREQFEKLTKEEYFIPVRTNIKVSTGKNDIADEDAPWVLNQAKLFIKDRLEKET